MVIAPGRVLEHLCGSFVAFLVWLVYGIKYENIAGFQLNFSERRRGTFLSRVSHAQVVHRKQK